jgi:hypothetical protein
VCGLCGTPILSSSTRARYFRKSFLSYRFMVFVHGLCGDSLNYEPHTVNHEQDRRGPIAQLVRALC